ncbi:MAG: cobalt ECF transporter T component CbiQ [Planctomycetia bacterium]|nr:cobalt ECF transporter T component CbiQ [Planctomycetia bacterium]
MTLWRNTFQIPRMLTAGEASILRRFSPVPKVTVCLVFLVLSVSFGRYDWMGCMVFACIPFFIALTAEVPVCDLLKRCCMAFPFVLCAGIANCFFDRNPVEIFSWWEVSGGVVSLFVLMMKTLAAVGMVLTLTACTPMTEIAGALRRFHVPCVLILQLQLLFRYLWLLMEESRNVVQAYFLRNPECRIIPYRDWGNVVGRLFLRTVERAGAIYRAMQCRLFHAGNPLSAAASGSLKEWVEASFLMLLLFILRYFL